MEWDWVWKSINCFALGNRLFSVGLLALISCWLSKLRHKYSSVWLLYNSTDPGTCIGLGIGTGRTLPSDTQSVTTSSLKSWWSAGLSSHFFSWPVADNFCTLVHLVTSTAYEAGSSYPTVLLPLPIRVTAKVQFGTSFDESSGTYNSGWPVQSSQCDSKSESPPSIL